MRSRLALLFTLTLTSCVPSGDTADETQGFVAPNSGFKLFGGTEERCLAAAGGVVAAGRALVSSTCVRYGGGQSWRIHSVQGTASTIQPWTNLGLCVDARGAAPFLAACDGSSDQLFDFGAQIIGSGYRCFQPKQGSLQTETPIVFDPGCGNWDLDVVWPYGFQTKLWAAAQTGANVFLDDPAPGWPVIGDPPNGTESFVLGLDNTIEQYTAQGLTCLTSGAFLSMQSCGQGAAQTWSVSPGWQYWGAPWLHIDGAPAGAFQPPQCLSLDDQQRVTAQPCQFNAKPQTWFFMLTGS
jgi:hypothetical protein